MPSKLHRCHWIWNDAGKPVQSPVVARSVCPGWAVPLTVGRVVLFGVQADWLSTTLTTTRSSLIVAFAAEPSVSRKVTTPSTSTQSRSCTRTVLTVSPGAKVSEPLVLT